MSPKDELPVAQFLTEARKTYGGKDVMSILTSVAMAHQSMATTIQEQASKIMECQDRNADRIVESQNQGAAMISGEIKLLREQLKSMNERVEKLSALMTNSLILRKSSTRTLIVKPGWLKLS